MVKSNKLKTIKSALVGKWVQFSMNTSLHGWKYFALPNISRFERCVWYIVCIASLSISIYLLASAWSKFQANPTIIVTESTQHSIYKYEFPAVAICSFNKISKTAAFAVARKLEPNSSNVEWLANSFRLFIYLLGFDNHDPPMNDVMKLQEILKRNGLSEDEVFKMITPPCSELLKKCLWKGEDRSCDILFEEVKTVVGYCCSFNYFALKGGSKASSEHSHRMAKQPRRTSSCGFQSGLEILIDNDPENYFATLIPSVGFNVLIHNPYDFPNKAVNNILCEINSNNFIGINPEIISATKNIRSKSIAVRKCLFANEKKMDYFSKYTFHNCLAECKIVLIAQLCNCTSFSIYDKRFHGNTRACSFDDIGCFMQNAPYLYNMSLILESKLAPAGKCDCLPACESTSYIPESSKGILDPSYSTNMISVVSGMETKNHTVIRVFFNDLLGTRHRRDVLFTWHMLMGSYGGILGLFTGFSFMLVVEIIYHFLVHHVKDDKMVNKLSKMQSRGIAKKTKYPK